MPYIVSTRRTTGGPFDSMTFFGAGCAYATLDEAKQGAFNSLYCEGVRRPGTGLAAGLIDALPESGGRIGPLPDGTTIDVLPVEYVDLVPEGAYAAGWELRAIADYNAQPGRASSGEE